MRKTICLRGIFFLMSYALMATATPSTAHDGGGHHWHMAMSSGSALTGRERKDMMRHFEKNEAFTKSALIYGNPQAKLTVIEFGDYNCGYCRRMHEMLHDVVAQDGDIRLVYREYPALGRGSVEAARLVLAAQMIDKEQAKQLSNALYQLSGRLGEAQVLDLATNFGFDKAELLKKSKDSAVDDALSATFEMSKKFEFSGTPTIITNGEISEGYLSRDEFRELIAIARANRS